MTEPAIIYGHRPASTVAQFCDDYCISRTHFYQLIKDGKGPDLMKLGRRTLISAEAAARWRKQIEFDSAGGVAGFIAL